MLTLQEKVGEFQPIVIEEKEKLKPSVIDYLDTYSRQYNDMIATFIWIKDKLSSSQIAEWRQTIRSLEQICRALDSGFDPVTPPKNWSSGQLVQYLAPIPENVRKQIDLAEPVFGRQQILIYDPNPEHFRRPKVRDPMAVGFVNLTDLRIHFLIGAWDLAEDLKFIELPKEKRSNPVTKSTTNLNELMDLLNKQKETLDSLTFKAPSVKPNDVWYTYNDSTFDLSKNKYTSGNVNLLASSQAPYTSNTSNWAHKMVS